MGSPDAPGEYWIVWRSDHWAQVYLVSVSPAVVRPDGPLLLKNIGGMAYDYQANRGLILAWAPVVYPLLPDSMEVTS